VFAQDRPSRFTRQVVAGDNGDARPRQAQLRREPLDHAGGAVRVGRAEVADDGDAVRQAVGQHWPQLQRQARLVAQLGIGPLGQLLLGQGALGQVLVDQGAGAATLDQRAHHARAGVDAVTRKTGAATDGEGGEGGIHGPIVPLTVI
jgi:hypothetical protein